MADSHVIVGTDGSGVSLRAVEWAAREAALRDRPLRIVSVPALPPRMSWYQHSGPPAVADIVHERAEEAVAGAAARAAAVEPGVAVSTAVLAGAPSDVLAETADGAAMLVVGSRGGGGFAALLLGSVGRDVAFTADCPVVVVREDAMAGHRQVVIGVHDGAQASALGFAFEEAQRRLARLHVVYGWQIFLPGRRPGRAGVRQRCPARHARGSQVAGRADRALAAEVPRRGGDRGLRARLAQPGPGRRLCPGRPGGAGPGRRRPRLRQRRPTALAHAMLNHAHCPVAIIPESA